MPTVYTYICMYVDTYCIYFDFTNLYQKKFNKNIVNGVTLNVLYLSQQIIYADKRKIFKTHTHITIYIRDTSTFYDNISS